MLEFVVNRVDPGVEGGTDAVHANARDGERRRRLSRAQDVANKIMRLASTKLLERAPRMRARALCFVLPPHVQLVRDFTHDKAVEEPSMPKIRIHWPPLIPSARERRLSRRARRAIHHDVTD